MIYLEEIRGVLAPHVEELRRGVEEVRQLYSQSLARTEELQGRVVQAEVLLALASTEESQTRNLTLHDAMVEVLTVQPEQKMRPAELAAEIRRRGLYRMRDGRSVETQQIHARVGHYPQLFIRDGTFIKLVE